MRNQNYESQERIMHKEVILDYDRLQEIAKDNLKQRKEICYKRCPRIKQIDDELSETGLKIVKSIIIANKEDKDKYLEEIKSLTQNLKKEKNHLLKSNGFHDNYFEDIYSCLKCRDTGYINNKKCECFNQKLINKYYKEYDILNVLKNSKFSDFNLDYYPKENLEKYNSAKSPYEVMKSSIYPEIMNFIKFFGNKNQNMIFQGTEGLGKTFLCRCIGNSLLSKGHSVIYISACKLFELHEKRQFSKPISEIELKILNMVSEVELLIIDDLGTEFMSPPSLSEFFNILNTRLMLNKSTIISTNLNSKQIIENYTSRIFSRIFGEYNLYKFIGEDIRFTKRMKK